MVEPMRCRDGPFERFDVCRKGGLRIRYLQRDRDRAMEEAAHRQRGERLRAGRHKRQR